MRTAMSQPRLVFASLILAIVGASTLACSRDPNRVKKEYLASGNGYFDQKKYSEAIIEYRNAIKQDPLYGDAHLKLAETYQRMGDVPNATREYVRAADTLPSNLDVQLKAASFLLLVGRFEEVRS